MSDGPRYPNTTSANNFCSRFYAIDVWLEADGDMYLIFPKKVRVPVGWNQAVRGWRNWLHVYPCDRHVWEIIERQRYVDKDALLAYLAMHGLTDTSNGEYLD
jgi:hypothetical protein